MLLITDKFKFSSISRDVDKQTDITIISISPAKLQQTFKELREKYKDDIKSLVTVKKTLKRYEIDLGGKIGLFQSKMFSAEDFLKITDNNILLYGEYDKMLDKYSWYLITKV